MRLVLVEDHPLFRVGPAALSKDPTHRGSRRGHAIAEALVEVESNDRDIVRSLRRFAGRQRCEPAAQYLAIAPSTRFLIERIRRRGITGGPR